MPLPLFCPKSKNSACSGDLCPMYTIDWRSKDEYCMIGYYPAGSRKKLGEAVVDTYAKKGINEEKTAPATKKIERKQGSKDFINLKDIPDDYEEEFWS